MLTRQISIFTNAIQRSEFFAPVITLDYILDFGLRIADLRII
ncbi:hypothetical protein D1AOALGA4SA_10291 [Olavius algarvensis Delta 1 endosymbiont]|nr:hypothetical protein D1AOALGA4SA_10291 [Olavius algarvensis Delta 1 endosymbiont]